MDWANLAVLLLVAFSGAASALAAYFSRQTVNTTPVPVTPSPYPLAIANPPSGAAPLDVGGSSGDVAATILPWLPASYMPAWDQNEGVLPDGQPDPQHFNDCGETCVSMAIAGVWGCPIEPGAIRQYLTGSDGSGLTDGAALVKALAHWSVKAHLELLSGFEAWNAVTAVVGTHRPVIMLGRWEGPGTALHWIVAVSNGGQVIQYLDPWDGTRAFIARTHFLQMEQGQLVVLDSHCHFDCRNWPNPS